MHVSVGGGYYLEVSNKRQSKGAERKKHQTTDVQPTFVYCVSQLKVSEDGNNEAWKRQEATEI